MPLDISKPDGTGKMKITSWTVSTEDSTSTLNFEGPIEGYGIVRATQHWTSTSANKDAGTMKGRALTILNDGTINDAPLRGTFVRKGLKADLFFTDAVSNGGFNFVHWKIDLITKDVIVHYWDLHASL